VRKDLTASIQNHLYKIYANEKTRINQINVSYDDSAFSPVIKYDDYKFENECTKRLVPLGTKSKAGSGDVALRSKGFTLPESNNLRVFMLD
jgi:hypothetical protein